MASRAGCGAEQQGTSRTHNENNHSQGSRADDHSSQTTIAPSIPSWLHKLPSEVSGYSRTGPSSLARSHAPSFYQPDAASFRPARTSLAADWWRALQPAAQVPQETQRGKASPEDWNDEESVGEESSISQRSITHQMPSVHKTSSAHQTAISRGSEVQPAPTVYRNDPVQQKPPQQPWPPMPRSPPDGAHTPVIGNFHNYYSPLDSSQNITDSFQYQHTTDSPHTAHAHNKQRHINDSSRPDITTPWKKTVQLRLIPEPRDRAASPPSESIPLRGPLYKCKRGLFFDRGLTTHKHVPDERPC